MAQHTYLDAARSQQTDEMAADKSGTAENANSLCAHGVISLCQLALILTARLGEFQ
jgi:hypothetical protein